MARSVHNAIESSLASSSGHRDPAAMIRARSTVPIMASGRVVPHSKAAHMTATNRPSPRVTKTLASRGPSTHDERIKAAYLSSLRRRQEDDFVLGRERHHVRRVLLLHAVNGPEQIIELAGRRHPEEA